MRAFELDDAALSRGLEQARRLASRLSDGDSLQLLSEGGWTAEQLLIAWYSKISTSSMYEAAVHARSNGVRSIETFSPLYMTNTCDAECLMCGMRRNNAALRRETAEQALVNEQLRILSRRGMRAVALLTGEYRRATRSWALRLTNGALRSALSLGFRHVLLNIGSVEEGEFDILLDGIARDQSGALVPRVTMCTFQETYSRSVYAKFMGTDADNPRADFDRRLENFDRSFAAGVRVANPGVLLGLHTDVGYELLALAWHVEHLLALGMGVYISVPRLRTIAGGSSKRGLSDADFVRFISLLALGLPGAKIVLTTRESPDMQNQLAPIVDVISSGSSAVAPYTPDGAYFPLEASQFHVIDQRPFEAVLGPFLRYGPIENFVPPS